jgi:multimeric flavodoxin WrbA
MKVIGISGSPRKGNTEWIVKRLLDFISDMGFDTELILLRSLNIESCSGCLACEIGGKNRKSVCVIKDDMQEIYPKILEADGIILGTPVYFELLSALLKNFMDRTCPIWTKLEGKSLAGIAVAEDGIGKAIDNLKTYGRICNMNWVGYVTALAKRPGEVSADKTIESRINKLAIKFADSLFLTTKD